MKNKRLIWINIISIVLSFVVAGILAISSLQKLISENNIEIAQSVSVSAHNDIVMKTIEPEIVSRVMASDNSLKNAIKNNDTDFYPEFLSEIKEKFKYDTVFFINDADGNYYTDEGVSININGWPSAGWYFELRDSDAEYNMNIDYDELKWHKFTVFINQKVFDDNGKYIGLCGVGAKIDIYSDILDYYEKTNDINAYIIDEEGNVLLDSSRNLSQDNVDLIMSKADYDGGFNYVETESGGCFYFKNIDNTRWQLVISREKIDYSQFSYLIIRLIAAFVVITVVLTIGIYRNFIGMRGDYIHQFEMSRALADGVQAVYYLDLDNDTYIIENLTDEMRSLRSPVADLVEKKEHCLSRIMEEYCRDYVHEDDYERMRQELQISTIIEKLKSRGNYYLQYRVRKNSVNQSYFEIHISSADNAKNKHKAFMSFRNIDEQKEKEIEQTNTLNEAYHAANRANSAKTVFMSHMSHDIRTPLNAITGMSAIAAANLNNPDKIKHCLTEIDSASAFLLSLVNEVLDMNTIETGSFKLNIEAFRIEQLVEEFKAAVFAIPETKRYNISIDVQDIKHQGVLGDKNRINQCLMNFMSNAVKYTPAGGEISVTVKEVKTNRPKRGCFEITFKDNGIGMSQDFVKKIFEPFARSDDKRAAQQHGAGLGMPLTLTIIQMMNGDIRVESELNRGSTFTATIFLELQDTDDIYVQSPDSVPHAPAPKPKDLTESVSQLSNEDFTGKKVLLAEDNEINAEIAIDLLEMTGLKAEHVWDGQEAVSRMNEVEDGYYDMIFMDIQMPNMNGYDAARAIRGNDRTYCKEIPIVALSANALAEDVHMSKVSGMQEHIAKPMNYEQLLAVMRKYLN